tara:strand:+ start:4489 stop:4875 length:387 start_codon:yes stop_codon:yes gene_type:complete
MKIKLTLIAIAFNNNHDAFSQRRNVVLLHKEMLPSTFLLSENSIDECLKKLSEKYLNHNFVWLDMNLVEFRRVDEDTCEAVYITQFPYASGFNRLGTPTNFYEQNLSDLLGEYYIDIISSHTARKFVL